MEGIAAAVGVDVITSDTWLATCDSDTAVQVMLVLLARWCVEPAQPDWMSSG